MTNPNARKRRIGPVGIKALIASASIAATIAGWALLPSNDPRATAASDQSGQQPAVTVPGTTGTGTIDAPAQLPDPGLPQINMPQGFGGQPDPFTRTHSSR